MAGVMRIIDALWGFDKDDELTERLQVLPVWSLVGAVISFLVIYALATYGDRDTVERLGR